MAELAHKNNNPIDINYYILLIEHMIHLLLNRDFAHSAGNVAGEAMMPAPKGRLVLAVNAPHDSPTIELLPGLLSYYPLKLTDILMRDKLRAHFDFYCTGQSDPLPTCFDREEMDMRVKKELVAFADEPVAGWNLIQLQVAKMLIDKAPNKGRAVSLDALREFQSSPYQFYADMTAPVSNIQ